MKGQSEGKSSKESPAADFGAVEVELLEQHARAESDVSDQTIMIDGRYS